MFHRWAKVGLLVVAILSLPISGWAEVKRFSAMLAGGQRVDGQRLHEWYQLDRRPRLDGTELLNPGNPFVWLRDRTLHPNSPPDSYVELINGDRLPGEVVAFVGRRAKSASLESAPPHLVVQPAVDVSPPSAEPHPHVRVLTRFVRRIVWQRRGSRARYRPGTLRFRDGRVWRFRAARFAGSGVRVLVDQGQQTASFHEIADLHLSGDDAWEAYFDELAILSPRGEDRLIQIDSIGGLVATGSLARFQIMTHGNRNDSDRWWHAVQPAWCLETLWVQNARIWSRRSWPAEAVPLTHIHPTRAVARSVLSAGNRGWQRNLSVKRRPLHAGGQPHGWGFGVHAYSELHFPLHELVTGFRTRMGLDEIVGEGGCAIGRVFAGSTKENPLYESPHIVGTGNVHDTGNLSLGGLNERQRTLILQVDAAHRGRPAKADPFDIRDVFNWLDPTLTLDKEQLRREVLRRAPQRHLGFAGWKVDVHDEGDYTWGSRFERYDHPRPGRFVNTVHVKEQPLTFRRSLKIGDDDQWLLVSAYRGSDNSSDPELIVRIDGIDVTAQSFPQRHGAQLPRPVVVSLAPYAGHTIDLEVVHAPNPNPSKPPVHWHGIEIRDQLPMLHRVLEDDGRLTSLDRDDPAQARWTDADHHAGDRSIEIPPGAGQRLRFGRPISIRGNPRRGQQRHLRFAFRKIGQGSVQIELEHRDADESPAIYTAGVPRDDAQAEERPATNVWKLELPDKWIVMTRDVYGDFGELDVTGLVVRVPDGQRLRLDHVYFARTMDDFRLLPAAPSPEATNQQARRELARAVLDKGHPATVALDVDHRLATGVLVGGEGYVLTAGHVIGAPGKEVVVQLPSGQRLAAKGLGICRSADLGLLKIDDRMGVPLQGLQLHEQKDFPAHRLYVGFACHPFVEETPGAAAHIVGIKRSFRETLWTDFSRDDVTTGGPLLDRDGRIIGTHIRNSHFGGFLYAKSFVARENWERLRRGEVWGDWFPGTGPMLGVVVTTTRDGARVTRVMDDSPAAAADVKGGDLIERIDDQPVASLDDVYRLLAARDPGQEVAVHLRRGDAKLQQRIKLMPRVP